jgi:hypothetical protein
MNSIPFFSTGDISTRRLKLWEESFEELLLDPIGRDTLQKFLDKEYSGENLRFWMEAIAKNGSHFDVNNNIFKGAKITKMQLPNGSRPCDRNL